MFNHDDVQNVDVEEMLTNLPSGCIQLSGFGGADVDARIRASAYHA